MTELERKLDDTIDGNKKLRELLFGKAQPKTRTKRPTVPKLRSAASYRRKAPAHIDEQQIVCLDSCPSCGGMLGDPSSSWSRTIEDIVISPKTCVTEWIMNRYWCTGCHRQVSGSVPGLLPKSQLGPHTLTMVVIARYRLNLPYNKIVDYLKLCFGLTVSEGEIAHLLKTAAQLVGNKWDEIKAAVKAGKSVHCDETGWYIDGVKAWAHVFATEHVVLYEIADTRGKGLAKGALGEDFMGVRVTDCLPNYKSLPGLHQICWAHLTREALENHERDPTSRERKYLAKALCGIYAELRTVTNAETWNKQTAKQTKSDCQDRTKALTEKTWKDRRSQLLVQRLVDYQHALFTCLSNPDIAPDNNHAERCLRKLVVQRKISGGNRSGKHALIRAKLMSVIETLRLESDDMLTTLQTTLQAGMQKQLQVSE